MKKTLDVTVQHRSRHLPVAPEGPERVFASSQDQPGEATTLISLRPGPGLFVLLVVWLVAAVPASVWPAMHEAWLGLGIAILAVAFGDALMLFRTIRPRAERLLPASLAIGQRSEAALRVHNQGTRAIALRLFDEHPACFDVQGLPARLHAAAGGWAQATYAFRPLERGRHRFGQTAMLVRSPLAIWDRHLRAGAATLAHVYPNFAAVAKYALLATDHRLSQIGIRQRRRRGEGLEFHQLREHRQGDSLRQIDWKATSRQHKLIAREYQDERDQHVFFLVDCGRRMAAHDSELSHFDLSLNAVLLLAYVALRQGDAVGVMTFSGESRYLPARKGLPTLTRLLEFLFDLQPSLQTSDYVRAASEAVQRLHKRSLIVIVTNLRDEDSEELLMAQRLLRQRHLVLLANLREESIGALLKREVVAFEDAVAVAAAHRYLAARRQVHRRLTARGALSIDAEPQQLSVQLVNRYLEVKRSGRL